MKKLILTMCLTAAGVFGAAAQMRLTLGEALDLALSENPTVKVAEMEVQRFDYVKRQTWGSWIPQISVGGTYTRSIVKQSMTKGLRSEPTIRWRRRATPRGRSSPRRCSAR